MALVPIALLGQQFGIEMRGIKEIVTLASVVHCKNYWRTGRTLERLGLQAVSAARLRAYIIHGDAL